MLNVLMNCEIFFIALDVWTWLRFAEAMNDGKENAGTIRYLKLFKCFIYFSVSGVKSDLFFIIIFCKDFIDFVRDLK